MQTISNKIINGSRSKPVLLDAFFYQDQKPKACVIFSHGFKGFKDWGHFNALGKRFASEGFVFIKFNFSHNGTTVNAPTEFTDLEAFGNNNYSIELDDLQLVIDWALSSPELEGEVDKSKIYLLGHSRGGGISILKAAEDKRVKKLVTWASVCDFLNRNKKKTIETWERDGVVYADNARTKQKMPLYYQFYKDMLDNAERFDIHKALKSLQIPVLVVHGTKDEAVPVREAEQICKAAPHAQLVLVEGAGHTFDVKHPFDEGPFPGNAELVIFKTLEFLKS